MPRGSELVGLPVLAGSGLKRIGLVEEVLLSRDGSRVCGLVLDGSGWLQPKRTLDFQAVRAVGETHIVADEVYLPHDAQARCCKELRGMPVLRSTGDEAGLMDDFHFDAATGRLTALQLSHGFVDDLLRGKEIVSLEGPLAAGEAVILLDGPGDLSGGAV